MGLTQNVPSTNICFYKYAHNSGPRGSPDMILTAFDVKFDEKKDEIPPKVYRPLKKQKQKRCRKSGHPKSRKKQCRESGFIDFDIPSYTFIYLQIALYTFIYPHLHQNIEY